MVVLHFKSNKVFFIQGTLKGIIIETRADSVVVNSNGFKPVLAAIMHPGRLF
jgi:hypothetical protein